MASKYVIVQYVPDPIADERMNIGVLSFDENGVHSRFISSWERALRFGQEDTGFLRTFADQISLATLPLAARGVANAERLTVDRVLDMASSWRNSIQFTEPRASLESAETLLDQISTRFLFETARRPRAYRDRNVAAAAARRGVRSALEYRVGDNTDLLLKIRHTVNGARDQHVLDAVVENGTHYLVAQGLSFDVPESTALKRLMDATAWLVDDLRMRESTLPVGIVTLAPRKEAEWYGRSLELLHRAQHILSSLGAAVIQEDQVHQWADGALSGSGLARFAG